MRWFKVGWNFSVGFGEGRRLKLNILVLGVVVGLKLVLKDSWIFYF